MAEENKTAMFQNYKLLPHFVVWSVFFLLLSNVTAGKPVDVFGTPLPIAVFYFPVVYVISDVLTEVYGYAVARRVLWYTLGSAIMAAFILHLVVTAPPAASFANNEAFSIVLGTAPRFTLASIIAMFAGDITNNYILAKMKILSKGGNPSGRFVLSTLGGELVNTALFFVIGLWGIIPPELMLGSILFGAAAKTLVEIVLLPVTLRIVKRVKRIEGIDHYDVNTNFNPFKF